MKDFNFIIIYSSIRKNNWKMCRLTIVALISVFYFVGCIDSSISDHALEITPLPVEANNPINIKYNAKHPLAKYSEEDALYATISIITATRRSTYRIRLERRTEYLFTGVYKIPASAVFINISVGPKEWIHDTETFSSVVCADGVPVAHSLPHFIYSAPSFEYAKQIFLEDEKLYPQTMDRYIPYWKNRIKFGIDTNDIRVEIDSLLTAIPSMHSSRSNDLAALTACALAYFSLHDFPLALQSLNQIESNIGQGMILPLSVQEGLEVIWENISSPILTNNLPDDARTNSLVAVLSKIATRSQNISMLNWVIRNLMFHSGREGVGQNNGTIPENIYNILMNMAVMPNHMPGGDELIYFTARLLYNTGHYEETKKLIERNLLAFDEALLWVRDDISLPITPYPEYGISYESKLLLGQSCMELKDSTKAITCLTSLVKSTYREDNSHVIGKAIEFLAKYYLQMKLFDNIEKYIAYALIYNTDRCDSLYDAAKSANCIDRTTPSKTALIDKYYEPRMISPQYTPTIHLVTNNRDFAFGRGNTDSVVLFFSSQTCSICRNVYPFVFASIAKCGHIKHVIFITDEEQWHIKKYTDKLPANIVSISKLSPDILRAFDIRGYPSVVFVGGPHILYKGSVNAETTVPLIESIIARHN